MGVLPSWPAVPLPPGLSTQLCTQATSGPPCCPVEELEPTRQPGCWPAGSPTCQPGGHVQPAAAGLLVPPGPRGGCWQAARRSYQTLSRQQGRGSRVYFFPKASLLLIVSRLEASISFQKSHLFSSDNILLCEDTPPGAGKLRPPAVSGWAAGQHPVGWPGRTGPVPCSV